MTIERRSPSALAVLSVGGAITLLTLLSLSVPSRTGTPAHGPGALALAAGATIAPPTGTPCPAAPVGLIAWWPLDGYSTIPNSNRMEFVDLAGVRNNAAAPVAWKSGPGKADDSVGLNLLAGPAQFLEARDHPELDLGPAFTLQAWVRFAAGSLAQAGVQTILDKRQASPLRGYHLFLYQRRVGLQLAAEGAQSFTNYIAPTSAMIPDDGAWHLVTVTTDRPVSSGQLFIDGVRRAFFNPASQLGSLANGSPLRLGARSASAGGLIKGELDEIQIFGRALTSREVTSFAAAGKDRYCKDWRWGRPYPQPPADPRPLANAEPVNVDVYNDCNHFVNGFRFILSEFTDENQQPVDISSAYPSFSKVYEDVCPTPAAGPTPGPCNPFTPSEAVPTYATDRVSLNWTAGSGTVIPPGGTGHFGYDVAPDYRHHILAEYLGIGPTSAGATCSTTGYSVDWRHDPYNPNDPYKTITATLQNQSLARRWVRSWPITSNEHVALDALVATNPLIARALQSGAPPPNASASMTATLGTGQGYDVPFLLAADTRTLILVSEWRRSATGPVVMRAFNARYVNVATPPAPPRTPIINAR